jgi:hypothetical protein
MSKAGYSAVGVSSALTAATPKTILTVLAPATFGVDLTGIEISFDGATSTAIPATIEICTLSGATAGTSTAVTVGQIYGRSVTPGFTSGTNFTAEPTVLAAIEAWTEPVYGGLVIVRLPQGQTYDAAVSTGFAIRVTAAAAVNARATFQFERC